MTLLIFRKFILIFFSISLLTGCGGSSESKTDSSELPNQADVLLESINQLKGKVSLPLLPSREQDKMGGIVGIDKNKNGVRDYVENIIYQGVMYDDNALLEYNKLLELIRLLQPPASPIPDSINEIEIACFYETLSQETKNHYDYNFIHRLVLNNQERYDAFVASSKDITLELRTASCD